MIDLPASDALALTLHHSPGVLAVLVGSGLSRSAGIPTGWEITLDLIRRLAALDNVLEHEDWAKWYREKYGKDPGYSEILDTLASTPAERRAILHNYIEATGEDEARKPTKAHQAIARLVASGAVKVVITTNFDRLIESALHEVGIQPTVIASEDALAGATPLVHSKCTVIKVHGDYLDTRIKNTDAELAAYSSGMDGLLDQVFDNFGLLSVGWSGEWDAALRSAISRAPSRRYPFYWAARGTLGQLARDLLNQRGGRDFAIADADAFFGKLADTLDALTTASRPHPQSVTIAVALAKRYCREDKFALEWAEFLHDEVEKIKRFVNGPDYPTASPTNATLNALVDAFVGRTEALRRACLVCGRWGTAEANRAVNRAINSLSFASDSKGGYVLNIALREFAASICFYWTCAGLLDRDAWLSLQALQAMKLKGKGDSEAAVMTLPFPIYQQTSNWKFLSGLENHHTPISDYLAPLFKREAVDIALGADQADDLFDRAEIMISIVFAHGRVSQMESVEGLWFFMPLGRFIWKGDAGAFVTELDRIENLPDDDAMFKAGLLGGSKSTAKPTLQAIRDYQKKTASSFW